MSTILGKPGKALARLASLASCFAQELLRLVATAGGIVGMMCIASLDRSRAAGRHVLSLAVCIEGPLAALRSLWMPRVWVLVLLLGLFLVGNWCLGCETDQDKLPGVSWPR